ncbi:MAG: LamB/YcsF family protein [Leucobacter sp.]
MVGETRGIDLNSDLGEQMGDDESMLQIVTSANVACGFHAGDARSILETLRAAARRGVTVGAHVSYPDREGFGRRATNPEDAQLESDIAYQIGALRGLAAIAGTEVRYVKPHGALYNTIASDERQAAAVIRAMRAVDPELPLVCLASSRLVEQAVDSGLRAIPEAFADRAYEPTGALVGRSEPGAVLHDPDEVATRMVQLVGEGVVTARDGSQVRIQAESICVHGDSHGAVQMAVAVRDRLLAAGLSIRPFVV